MAMLALVMSPAPARADGHAWDYLLPAPGVCGPVESDPNAAPADQMAAGLCLANAARANYQRGRLNPLGTLQIAAYFKASDVLRCQTGDPHTACGRLMDYWFKRYTRWGDCPSGAFAENIYWGSGSLGTAREAVRWWLNSDQGHRRALLDPQYAYQGMYLKKGTYHGYPNAQVWVHYLCRW
jgi:uncharacterized protein YkwD